MKISFFDLPKPKQFNYKPRFYNAQKDELEQRIKAHNLSQDQTEQEKFHIQMKSDWERQRSKRKSEQKRSRTTLLIMLALVVILLYILFK